MSARARNALLSELRGRLHTYETASRYFNAAEGQQWFNETPQREANQRLLDATRKRLGELESD